MKVAICDDNEKDLLQLYKRLKDSSEFKDASFSVYSTGDAFLKGLNSSTPFDFVFLDVDMPDRKGTEIGKILHKTTPQTIIIFVSAHPQYAIEAFDCFAFNYLLKNSSDEKFNYVLSKAIHKFLRQNKTVLLKRGESQFALKLQEINYVECFKKNIIYHTDANAYSVRSSISSALEELKDYGFYQVHQGYIVNFAKVRCWKHDDVILKSNETIPVSRRKRNEIMIAYAEYLKVVAL